VALAVAVVGVVGQRSSAAELVDFLDLFRSAIMRLESLHNFLIGRSAVSKGNYRNEGLATFAAMKAGGPISAPMSM